MGSQNKTRSFKDKCFKDEEGNLLLGQKPNLLIIVWVTSVVLMQVFEGKLYDFFDLVGFGALFTWAWLEIFSGVNYFRRFLGAIVMILLLYSRVY